MGVTPETRAMIGAVRGMPVARTERLRAIEERHFWFVARRRLIEGMLVRHVRPDSVLLDVGCGTAWLAGRFAERGYRVIGIDLNAAPLLAQARAAHAPMTLRADAERLPLRARSLDAALLLDVLEHADDAAVMRALHGALTSRGVAVLTVPACPGLWSYRDVAAGHLRRYTRERLLSLLQQAGYEVLEVHYYQCLLFPLLSLTRLLGRKGPALRDVEDRASGLSNWLLTRINLLEVALGRAVRWPIGSSLAVVCRKAR